MLMNKILQCQCIIFDSKYKEVMVFFYHRNKTEIDTVYMKLFIVFIAKFVGPKCEMIYLYVVFSSNDVLFIEFILNPFNDLLSHYVQQFTIIL